MKYINDKGEQYNGRYVVADGIKYISPSETKLAELGYHVVVEQPQVIEEENNYTPSKEELISQLKEEVQYIIDRINALENDD